MPYIELTEPGNIVADGTYWSDTNRILSNDGACASGIGALSTNYMLLTNWGPTIPASGKITGVEAIFTCWATGGSATLYSALTINGVSVYGSALSVSGITAAATSFTLGGSANLWGNNLIVNQDLTKTFGIAVKMDSTVASTLRLIDYVKLRIYYDSYPYLTGARSYFPYSLDSLTKKNGGTTALSQILSEDVNRLGDCIYNIEKTSLNSVPSALGVMAKGVGFKNIYLYAITVTGTTTGSSYIYIDRLVNRSNSASAITEGVSSFAGSGITNFPTSTGEVTCKFVEAIGWVTHGSNTHPVYVSPRSYIYNTANGSKSYYFGFTAVGSGIVDTSQELANTGYAGALVTPAPVPSGILTVRMLALLNGVV